MGRAIRVAVLWLGGQALNFLLPAVLRYYKFDPDKLADEAIGWAFGDSQISALDVQFGLFWIITYVVVLVAIWPWREAKLPPISHWEFPRGIFSFGKWYPPIMAVDLLTDEEARRERDLLGIELHRVQQQLAITERLLDQEDRKAVRLAMLATPQPTEEYARLRDEVQVLREERRDLEAKVNIAIGNVWSELYGGLLTGKLIARGFVAPHKHGAPQVRIKKDEWKVLNLSRSSDSAGGGGISYIGLEIKRR